MGSCSVEVCYIPIEHTLELLLAEDQQVVKACLSDTPQEAFAHRIGAGSVIRCSKHFNGTRRRHSGKIGSKLAIVIAEQILLHLPIRGGFSQLLRDPGISRRSCDADMDDPSCLELDNEEGEERSKEEISHLQKVAGPDICRVIAQKGRPLLSSGLQGANVPHILLNGPLAHVNVQFQAFTTNPFSAPESILRCYLSDQGDGFRGYPLLMRSGLRLALPDQAKKLTMPTQQCVWLNDEEGLLPGSNQPGE